jgi:hypothetical protein
LVSSTASSRTTLAAGSVAIITIIVILLAGNLAGAALVLIWASVSGTRWRDLGFVRLRTARSIWPVMVAHAAFDVAAVLMIYWNLEEPLAHLLLHVR